jgi:hypothetical protein
MFSFGCLSDPGRFKLCLGFFEVDWFRPIPEQAPHATAPPGVNSKYRSASPVWLMNRKFWLRNDHRREIMSDVRLTVLKPTSARREPAGWIRSL